MAQTPLAEAGRLLAVFAHPDDEAFGAGGTLAKYASAGAHVTLLTMTRGEAGMSGDLPLSGPAEVGAQRAQELGCSCQVLGIQRLCLLGYPDGELAAQRPDELVAHIVRTMREMRPHVVVTFGPDGVTGHPDHIAISRLTTEAFHRSGDASQHPRNDMRAYRPERLFYVATPASVAKQREWTTFKPCPTRDWGQWLTLQIIRRKNFRRYAAIAPRERTWSGC